MSIHLFAPGKQLPLLLSLMVLFGFYPLMVELDLVRFFRFAFLLVMTLAVYSLGGKPRHLRIAAALAGPAAIAQLAAYLFPDGRAPLVAVVLGLVFLAYATAQVFIAVLRPGVVSTDKIAGAISVYLLLGLVFALSYGLVARLDPGAFRVPDGLALSADQSGAGEYTFIYYSFTTLTTLGYGEITPANHWSQTLAWVQAVVGQLFLAVLVARLVGLHIVHTSAPDEA